MKRRLALAAVALALGCTPAIADPPQRFDWRAAQQAFSIERPFDAKQCFDGRYLAGVNRSRSGELYVQSRQGGVYVARLSTDCDALASAQTVALRSAGSDTVCNQDLVDVVVRTASGAQRCEASRLRKLSSKEVATLAAATQR